MFFLLQSTCLHFIFRRYKKLSVVDKHLLLFKLGTNNDIYRSAGLPLQKKKYSRVSFKKYTKFLDEHAPKIYDKHSITTVKG